MCLAIPMKLIRRDGKNGTAEVGGVRAEVRLDLVDAEVGQSLIVHAGYAIQVLDEDDARERLELLRQAAAAADADEDAEAEATAGAGAGGAAGATEPR